MGAPFRCIDIVDKCIDILRVGIIVLHGHFHIHPVLGSFTVDHILIERFLSLVQVRDKFLNSSLIVKDFLFLFFPVIP